MQDSWRTKVMFHWGFSVCLRVFPAVHYSSFIHTHVLRPPKVRDIITSQQITTSSISCWDFSPGSDSVGYRVRQLFFSERAFDFSNGCNVSEDLKLENFCRLTSGFKVPRDDQSVMHNQTPLTCIAVYRSGYLRQSSYFE
jgi:hypothetical protein